MVKPRNDYLIIRWLNKIAKSYFAEAHFLQNLARAVHMTCCEFDAPQFCKKKIIYSTNIENVSNPYLTDVLKQ